ncbi:cysteine desulfurase family protein [Planococcus sp. APC 4015]|nr:cysteine desulfurase family protein [Planococcus sp. APC 4015]
MLYLDNAATTAVRPEVLEAMMPYLTRWFGNASSHHTVGEVAAEALTDARRRVARVLGMRASDVVFTSGGTEANNLAVKGIALGAAGDVRAGSAPGSLERSPRSLDQSPRSLDQSLRSLDRSPRSLSLSKRHVVTTAIEHESILESVDYLARLHGYEITLAPVDDAGRLTPDALAGALRDDTALVSFGFANNEVGTIQDAAALAAVARARGIPVHVDAVQAAGWLPLSDTGADAISIAGHKLGAPKGTGVLAVRGRIPLEPLLHGGGQERGRRSGTEDIAGAVGLATALELAEGERAESSARVGALRAAFTAAVLSRVATARVTGDPVHRLPGTASFTFAGTSGEAVLLELERRGVVSSSGSACAAGSDEPSHVLTAMGVSPEVAQTAVRFTFPHDAHLDPDALAAAVAASVAAVTAG